MGSITNRDGGVCFVTGFGSDSRGHGVSMARSLSFGIIPLAQCPTMIGIKYLVALFCTATPQPYLEAMHENLAVRRVAYFEPT